MFESSGKDNCYLYRPVGIHFGGTLINNVVDWYDNIKIENNIFHNVLGRAIEVSCARNVSVKGNIFKQETEIIDGIIKCGSVRWGNTATWATFNGISDKQRYNCMNTKNSQSLFQGCTSYNFQYSASIQSADAHTYFPVINDQAKNILVGSYVSVGYGQLNDTKNGVNNDRGVTNIEDIGVLDIDDVKTNPEKYLNYEKATVKTDKERIAELEAMNAELSTTVDSILTDVLPTLMGA